MISGLNGWVREHLVCPRDRLTLVTEGNALRCRSGHSYEIRNGIPVLLLLDEEPTHPKLLPTGELREQQTLETNGSSNRGVDEYVQGEIVGTCGNFYRPLLRRLTRYPIPELRGVPPEGEGKRFLDVGCNWGRWSVAASRARYSAVGIDPSFDAVAAARRVALQLSANAQFLCADARWLPFADGTFDVVFSYSVFQHLRKADVGAALDEVSRVLVPGGIVVVEMPTAFGLRNLYVQAKRRVTRQRLAPLDFHVRYWSVPELVKTFSRHVGSAHVEVDSYFFINGQPADRDLLPVPFRVAITASEALRKVSRVFPFLTYAADSVYVAAKKDSHHTRDEVSRTE